MRSVLAAAVLLLAPAFAGCMDDGNAASSGDLDKNALDVNSTAGKLRDAARDAANRTGGNGVSNYTGDHLPHVHDYWNDRERVILADEAVDLEPWAVFHSVFMRREAAIGGAWWEPPQGKTVYEGTGKMEITIDWQDPTISGLSLQYRHAGTRDWSDLIVAQKGTVTTIDVTPQMTDLPHSGASRWAFYFVASGTPPLAVGAIKLKVELVRVADLHEMPGHTDFFAGADSLTIMDEETTMKSRAWTSQIVGYAQGQDRSDEGFTLPEGRIVPPGTEAIVADIKVTDDTPVRSIWLWYEDAGGNGESAEPLESPEAGVYRFLLPVGPNGVDSWYAEQSQWTFYLAVDTSNIDCSGCVDSDLKIHATMVAYKENPFGDEEEEDDDGF